MVGSMWLPTRLSHPFVSIFSTRLHRDPIHDIAISADGSTLFTVSKDCALKIFSVEEKRQLRSLNISELALSKVRISADAKLAYIGSWDNTLYTYSVDFGRIVDTLPAHEDAVSAIDLSDQHLVTGSWDSTVKVWQRRPTGLHKVPLVEFFDNETEVKAIAITADGNLVVSGSTDGVLHAFDLRAKRAVFTSSAHTESVNQIICTADSKRIISCSDDGTLRHTQIGGSQLASLTIGSPIAALAADGLGNLTIGGTEDGRLFAADFAAGRELHSVALEGGIRSLAVAPNASLVAVGGTDAFLRLFQLPE
jgi:factor associated with neutral sphingomyelinase activation